MTIDPMSGSSTDALSLEEFAALPTTVDFIFRYNQFLVGYIADKPYIRLGKIIYETYAILYTGREYLEQIYQDLGYNINMFPIVLGLLGAADLEASGILQVQQQPYLDLRGQGVILGFVDTGIDFTKDAFIYENNTSKIQYIWDQTVQSGKTPPGFYFGSEYTNADLNQALASASPLNAIPHRDTVGHGTFLASVAGSREQGAYIGAAPDAEIIAVKLRKARNYYLEKYLVPAEQENAYESSDLMLGVQYILDRAYELRRPVALCIGMGSNLSGHDGFCILDEFCSRISTQSGIAVSTAAGNESNAKHHTQGKLAKDGDMQSIEIKTDREGNNLYVNIWNFSSDRMSVSITSPTGEVVGRVPAKNGTVHEARLILEKSRILVEYHFPIFGSGSQLTTVKIVNATPGIWLINVYGDIVIDGTYHAWLPMTGFVNPSVEFMTPVPNTTVTVPSTSFGAVTCGAYNSRNNSIYLSSSWGPTRGQTVSPDLAAPGVDVAGVYPGGYGTMTGTSVAAAITTGVCALMLQWGIVNRNEIALNTFMIRSYLIKGCERDAFIGYPSDQWGYGRLNLYNTFQQMRDTQ